MQEARPILGGELRGKACPQQADAQALQIVVEVAEDRDRGARLDASEPRLPTCDKYLAPPLVNYVVARTQGEPVSAKT